MIARVLRTALLLAGLLLAATAAHAEADTVRIAMLYGLVYLPTYYTLYAREPEKLESPEMAKRWHGIEMIFSGSRAIGVYPEPLAKLT
jgi:hypothetical protein